MGDKNQKTFADLLSSVSSDEEVVEEKNDDVVHDEQPINDDAIINQEVTFGNLFKNDESRKTPPQQIAYYTKKEAEELELSKIGLSERVWHSLARSGFFFIKDVIDKSPSFLMTEISGFGPKSMKELSENLYHFGITLPQD